MLRNCKVLIDKLNEEQFNTLIELGFEHNGLFQHETKIDDTLFGKNYSCCGGTFELNLVLGYTKQIYIFTPYNRWWCDKWNIQTFTKDMDKFQEELKRDLQTLRKVGIIK